MNSPSSSSQVFLSKAGASRAAVSPVPVQEGAVENSDSVDSFEECLDGIETRGGPEENHPREADSNSDAGGMAVEAPQPKGDPVTDAALKTFGLVETQGEQNLLETGEGENPLPKGEIQVEGGFVTGALSVNHEKTGLITPEEGNPMVSSLSDGEEKKEGMQPRESKQVSQTGSPSEPLQITDGDGENPPPALPKDQGKIFPSATDASSSFRSSLSEAERLSLLKSKAAPSPIPPFSLSEASAILLKDAGIKGASKAGMPELLTTPDTPFTEPWTPAFAGSASHATSAPHASSSPAPEPVRLDLLIERIQQTVDSMRPPQPRHIVIQLDPPKLGLVHLDMQWTARGWNISWSVTQSEVRDWLVQQLPSLQQQNNSNNQAITWQAPVLQASLWNFSHHEHSQFLDGKNQEAMLMDDDMVSEEDPSLRPNEYWA